MIQKFNKFFRILLILFLLGTALFLSDPQPWADGKAERPLVLF